MPLTTTPTNALTITNIGSLSLAGAEISAFDPGSDRLYVTSNGGIQVVDLSNPAAPTLITTLNYSALGFTNAGDVTSVAIKGGVVAVSMISNDPTKVTAGKVALLDAATGTLLNTVTVGSHPDMVTFTPDGTKVLVANEGEYSTTGTGGKGSVSIIDLSGGAANATVTTAGFTSFDGQEAALRASGVRLFNGVSVSDDVEPEYIAVSPDGTKAMVTLQEANAVAILDIATATFTSIVPLGTKDFSALLADFSDRDGAGNTAALNLTTGNPVSGLYMPDAIASFTANGQTYYVVANEGDDRDDFLNPDETIRVGSGSYDLDNTVFPDETTLKTNAELGRLTVSNSTGLRGDTDGDGDIDQILAYGARSFSILDASGNRVFDSADIIERVVADLVPGTLSLADFDGRSDNKGPEPEGVTVGTIGSHTYAFVSLERANFTMVFDITNPANVTYTGNAIRAGDVAPEGALFIPAADSPTGEALYIQSSETSTTISVFEVEQAPYTLQILHASDWEGGIETIERAPNFAAIVDKLEDQYVNSITLSSGDNFIPGPFTAAGTDPSVRDELASFYEQALGLTAGSLTGIRSGTLPFNAVDIAVLNAIGVQASAMGNHEFDLGPNPFAAAFDFTASANTLAGITNIGAQFPYLSANLNFAGESSLSALYTAALRNAESYATTNADLANATVIGAERNDQQAAPWTIIEENGERIGVVACTTQVLESISSTGGVQVIGPDANDMTQLASVLQPYVDQLLAQGINKVILLSHLQQYSYELDLATKLSGVDVIISGGSHAIFADGTDTLGGGDTAAEAYPVYRTGADGKTVAVVNTGANYEYVGRLVVTFDKNGDLIADPDGAGALGIGGVDPGVSGAYLTSDAMVDSLWGNNDGTLDAAEEALAFADGTRGGEVKQMTDAVGAVITAKDGNVLGYSDVFLEGRRNLVRTQETNLGDLSADANLWAAKAYDPSVVISWKNGGGVRAEIGTLSPDAVPVPLPPEGGEVSQLDLENSLRFNNNLSLVTVSASELKVILEHAVAASGGSATPGQFAQVSGLRYSYDLTKTAQVQSGGVVSTAGQRIVSAAIVDEAGNVIDVLVEDGQLVGDANRRFRMVTLDFLAGGGDGYPFAAFAENVVKLTDVLGGDGDYPNVQTFAAAGSEQDAFAEYMEAVHGTAATAYDQAETGQALDTRIQNLAYRTDGVITGGQTVAGTRAADMLDGGFGHDTISGGAGSDTIAGGTGDDQIDGGAAAATPGQSWLLSLFTTDNDRLFGDSGDDKLTGGAGNDTLDGGTGNDVLRGDAGADMLIGGAGNDVMTGGGANDVFVIGLGNDIVMDFVRGDKLRLEAGVTVASVRTDRDIGGGSNLDYEYTFSNGATALVYDQGIVIPGLPSGLNLPWLHPDPMGLFG